MDSVHNLFVGVGRRYTWDDQHSQAARGGVAGVLLEGHPTHHDARHPWTTPVRTCSAATAGAAANLMMWITLRKLWITFP